MTALDECACCKQLFGQTQEMVTRALACGHVYHQDCIEEYCNVKHWDITDCPCPICKLTAKDLLSMERRAPEMIDDSADEATDASGDTLAMPSSWTEAPSALEAPPAPEALPALEALPAPPAPPAPSALEAPPVLDVLVAPNQVIIINPLLLHLPLHLPLPLPLPLHLPLPPLYCFFC